MAIAETSEEKPAVQGAAMEIVVSRQELVKELTATQSVVERKTTIPILSNFLFEVDEDRLTLTATDLDQAICTSTPMHIIPIITASKLIGCSAILATYACRIFVLP